MAANQWPDVLGRTSTTERAEYTEGPGFQVSANDALRNIEDELRSLGAEDIEVDANDPEVLVTYTLDDRDQVIGSDRWDNVRDNAQAIAKYVQAKRAIDRYKVRTPADEWSNADVPAVYDEPGTPDNGSSSSLFSGLFDGLLGGDTDEIEDVQDAADASMGRAEAAMILGVNENTPEDEIQEAARAAAQEHHPDHGGNEDRFKAVMQAREVLLE